MFFPFRYSFRIYKKLFTPTLDAYVEGKSVSENGSLNLSKTLANARKEMFKSVDETKKKKRISIKKELVTIEETIKNGKRLRKYLTLEEWLPKYFSPQYQIYIDENDESLQSVTMTKQEIENLKRSLKPISKYESSSSDEESSSSDSEQSSKSSDNESSDESSSSSSSDSE
jgi:hypothetical protein